MSFRKDILIVMTDRHMGNLILSIPAIRSISESFRDSATHILIDEAYREIVEATDVKLIPYPRRRLRHGPMLSRLKTYLGLIVKLRRIRPGIAIDLDGREYASVITFLSGAPVRFGPSTAKRSFLYNRKTGFSNHKHKIYRYLDIASASGARIDTGFYLRPSDEKRASLMEKLRGCGMDIDKPVVCIHAGAGKVYKRWRLDGFADVSDWLSSQAFQVVFIGGDNDTKDIQSISFLTKYPFYNMAGRLSIGELMALFEISILYIGNDSGPMHLAGAMGLPVVGLFGPADEQRWGPLTGKKIILRGRERCKKCYGRDCHLDFECITGISIEDVKRGVRELISPR